MRAAAVRSWVAGVLCVLAIAAVLALLTAPFRAEAQTALPQPACAPKPHGTGSYQVRIDVAGVGSAFVHWCPERYGYTWFIGYQRNDFQLKHPADTKGMTLEQLRTAYWQLNATVPPTDPSVKPLWDAGIAHVVNNPAPQILWKVTSNGGSATRPAYKYTVSGLTITRATTADPVKRAPVGAKCDPFVRDRATTSTDYMRFEDGWMTACTRVPANQQPLY